MSNFGGTVVLLLIVAVVGFLVIGAAAEIRCNNACLRLGWRDAKNTYPDLACYCIREENEYEIVKPLWEVQLGH